ncbi:MAG: hypothetical protein EOO17_02385 [Chloroflexi bacterium]|nr:MAG: hypothetical protein EOO17_02385 [Chloroflexota bacterium]
MNSKTDTFYWSDRDFAKIYDGTSSDAAASDDQRGSYSSIDKLLAQRQSVGRQFSQSDLEAIQCNFHNLIRHRCRRSDKIIAWVSENKESLPKVVNDLLQTQEPQWISIPGMYGGFSYGLIERDGKPLLVTDSWVRIVGGSGQRHEITPDKVEMTARGFV